MPARKFRFCRAFPAFSNFCAHRTTSDFPIFGKTRFAIEQNVYERMTKLLFIFLCAFARIKFSRKGAKAQRKTCGILRLNHSFAISPIINSTAQLIDDSIRITPSH
jgi:hypothetical protein